MPISSVFSKNANGAITFTGNSLGLSKTPDSQDMGTASAIGAYITTNTSDIVSTYPNGTTLSYTSNSSSARLTIPEGSTILRAEIIWGGTCQVQYEDHISELFNFKLQFITPSQSITIDKSAIDGRRMEPSDDGSCTFYTNWANVTEYVRNTMSGIYTVSGAIGTTQQNNNSYNSCGWTLAVCYENQSLPSRYMALYNNIQPIAPNSTVNLNLSNFKTPLSTSPNGRILLSALRGSAVDTGDQVLFGSTTSTLTPLSGPRNMVDNFFGSQINNDLGELDTTGTFGDRNQNIVTTTNISGGRQSQDITNVDASSKLGNNQTAAVKLQLVSILLMA
ncbi:conserved repeat domain protein [Clostridium botulinum C str. Eklund]|nr:conserved repeat domain protein [Clostridium botulinum C str. Eklund]NEZ48849.1 hypothetical protein [Clostridium botulinum]